jgi:hypothetical protein
MSKTLHVAAIIALLAGSAPSPAQTPCSGLLCPRPNPLLQSQPRSPAVYQDNGLSIIGSDGSRWNRLNQDTYVGISPNGQTCRRLGNNVYCQ